MRAALAAAALLLAGCPGDDCELAWNEVGGALDRSVLSVGGSSPDDVYLVGGALGSPGDALVLHYDGDAIAPLDAGRPESLWWVWTAPGGDVWMVGEEGLVLRLRGGAFTVVPSGVDATFYGVWGSADDDVWIVGGTPGGGAGEDDVVLRWDGDALAPVAVPTEGITFFKVWGAAADDVWVVGERGTALRWRGGPDWEDHSDELATPASILTVHGCSADEVYAVGGQIIARFDGGAWAPIPDVVAPSFVNGVSCAAGGVLVVGNGGTKLRFDRAAGQWVDEQFVAPFDSDFHGAFVAADGRMWAVGGNFLAPAGTPRTGVVGYRGCPVP